MLAIDKKRCFLKSRKDADRKRLFCSNVSTLLSMIVACNEGLLPDFKPKRTRYESVNYGIGNY